MTVWSRISTPLFSASISAFFSGRTLKPMMIAPDADASRTSLMFTAPTPEWRRETFTFSLERLKRLREHLGGADDVGLEDQRKILDPPFLDLVEELIEGDLAGGVHRLVPIAQLAEGGDGTRLGLVFDDLERVARLRKVLEARSPRWEWPAAPASTFSPRSFCMERTRPKTAPAK